MNENNDEAGDVGGSVECKEVDVPRSIGSEIATYHHRVIQTPGRANEWMPVDLSHIGRFQLEVMSVSG